MANEPRIEITGNLGRDAEYKTTTSGNGFLKMTVAQTPATKQADGTYLNGEPIWFDVTIFNTDVDAIELTKGTKVKLSGRLSQRTYEGKSYLNVVADSIEVVSRNNTTASSTDSELNPF